MNKITVVLGVAAVATLTGCKDPDYVSNRHGGANVDEPKVIDTSVDRPRDLPPPPPPAGDQGGEIPAVEPGPAPIVDSGCQCLPGTVHNGPCGCGAADCGCLVAPPPPPPPPPAAGAVAAGETVYIIQRGDTLSKISKRYNIKLDAIRALNPNIKKDVVWIGQKIKLPGKVEVGEQRDIIKEQIALANKPKPYAPYTGATAEYTVKAGDTLGKIAYGNGINIRQLKELNALSGDMIRIGQKLKIPANGAAAAVAPAVKESKPKVAPPPARPAADKANPPPAKPQLKPQPPVAPKDEIVAPAAPDAVAPVIDAPVAPAVAPADAITDFTTYIVQEGDDIVSLSISLGVSTEKIRELNNLGENDQLNPGQVIKIPADGI